MKNIEYKATNYPSDLADEQWEKIAKCFPSYPTIERFCGDEGYRKTFENDVLEKLGLGVDISNKN